MSIFFKNVKLKSLPPPSPPPPPPPPLSKKNSKKLSPRNMNRSLIESSESEDLQRLVHAPPFWKNKKKFSKQLSMNETHSHSHSHSHRDALWERRRRQKLRQERMKSMASSDKQDLTDEDLNELRGSIELGFGFSEEACQKLCNTLPALDLYFAVHRQLSISPVSTPHSNNSTNSLRVRSASFESPRSEDSWKILGPGKFYFKLIFGFYLEKKTEIKY